MPDIVRFPVAVVVAVVLGIGGCNSESEPDRMRARARGACLSFHGQFHIAMLNFKDGGESRTQRVKYAVRDRYVLPMLEFCVRTGAPLQQGDAMFSRFVEQRARIDSLDDPREIAGALAELVRITADLAGLPSKE